MQPRKARILIVDDDPDLVESLRLVLQSRSYRVFAAASASEGLQMLEQENVDLILLDVMLPSGTEGFHLVWKLRNHMVESLRQVPIIIISAIHHTTPLRLYGDQADAEYSPGEFLPVQAFLDKPVQPAALLRQVELVLAEKWKPD